MKIDVKSLIARSVVIVLVICLAVFLYFYGKQHQIYVDNRTAEIDGQSYRALSWAEYSIDGMDSVESYARMRDSVTVMRQKHTISLVYEDRNYEQHTVEAEFTIPVGEYEIVLSLPALAAGLGPESYLQEFVPMATQMNNQQQSAAEEEPVPGEGEMPADDMFGNLGAEF